jgi:mortality factor 4-like protein 1
MKLTVPELLKTILVDDWEAVTKNNQVRCSSVTPFRTMALTVEDTQLVTLPRSPTAFEVLEEFATYVKKNKPPQ